MFEVSEIMGSLAWYEYPNRTGTVLYETANERADAGLLVRTSTSTYCRTWGGAGATVRYCNPWLWSPNDDAIRDLDGTDGESRRHLNKYLLVTKVRVLAEQFRHAQFLKISAAGGWIAACRVCERDGCEPPEY